MVSGMRLLQQRKSKCKRGRKTLMKRLIGCPAGEWAKKLWGGGRVKETSVCMESSGK